MDLKYYKTSGKPWASFQNDDDVLGNTTTESESLLAAVIASGQPLTAKLLGAVTGAFGIATKQTDSDDESVASDVSTVSAAVVLNKNMLPKLPANPTAAKLDAYAKNLIAAAKSNNLSTKEVADVLELQGIDEDDLPEDGQALQKFVNTWVDTQKGLLPVAPPASGVVPVAMSWANQNLKTIFKNGQKPDSAGKFVARKYLAANGNVF